METPAQITSYQNVSGAYAEGLELGRASPLLRIDQPVRWPGHRRQHHLRQFQRTFRRTAIQGLPVARNLADHLQRRPVLTIRKGPIYAQISVNYVSRSLFATVNPIQSGFADTNPRDVDNFTSARTTVDTDFDYAATPRLTFFAQARNITNTPLEFTQSASSQYPIQREFYDMDWLVGMRLKLAS